MSKANDNDQEVNHLPHSFLDILLERGYRIIGKIGKGSYATVYVTKYEPKGCDKPTILACKMIDTQKVPKHFAKRFLPREIDIMRKVNHPNIITVHSIFAHNTIYLIFMSYASKGDLLNFIIKNGALKEQQAYLWFRQLTNAVNYLHEKGITHRDLKCENLLLTSKHVIKLADFGFAKFVEYEDGGCVKSKTYCGSISYAPPEVIIGTPYDPKQSDVWSMGVILFVMLNKAMPFDDSNIKYIYQCQILQKWHFRDKVINFLSNDVKNLVIRLLQPAPNDRWNTEEILKSDWFIKNQTMSFLEMGQLDEESDYHRTDENISTPSLATRRTSSAQKLTRKLKKDSLL